MPDKYRTTAAAALMGMSQGHLLDLIHRGAIQATDISSPGSKRKTYRISAQAIADFERSRKAVAMPAREVRTRRKRLQSVRQYF